MAGTPAADGFRMPAEWEQHERCLMAWPTDQRSAEWHDDLEAARRAYAAVVRAIGTAEPVLVVANSGEAATAHELCGDGPEIVELPIDDSWIRDNGPIVLCRDDGGRAAAHFRFNGWGGKYAPWTADATVAEALCARLGLRRYCAPFILEGGSIAVDGAGLLVTTERCLLNPNRNPGMSRAEIERGLCEWLGVERVVWLRDAIAEDAATDGHVDNVVAFVRPGVALLQCTDDRANPKYEIACENRRCLEAAGITPIPIDVLPYTTVKGRMVPVPYVNLYVANGSVVVPVSGHPADEGPK